MKDTNTVIKEIGDRTQKHKKLTIIVTALSVCVILLVVGLLTKNAETLTQYTNFSQAELDAMNDLTPYLNGMRAEYVDKWGLVNPEDPNSPLQSWASWTEITPSTVLKKDNIVRFNLEYTLPPHTLDNSPCLKYQLPTNLTVHRNEPGKVYNPSGIEVGEFLITTDGKVIIEFYDNYVEENTAHALPITGGLSFQTEVSNVATDDDGHSRIEFTDNLSVNIETKQPNEDKSKLKVSKSATNVDYENNTITWQIEIESKDGTAEPVEINDVMQSIHADNTASFVLTDKNGNTLNLSNYNFSLSQDGKGFNMTVPQMNAGDKYILTYTTALDQGNSGNTVHVNNRASAGSEDERERPYEDSHDCPIEFNKDKLKKSGTYNYETGLVDWTVEVNGRREDISGYILTDEILHHDLGYDPVWQATGPEQTTEEETTGSSSQGTSGSGTGISAGQTGTTNLPHGDATFIVNVNPPINGQSQITLPFTFPAGSNQAYQITYSYSPNREPGEYNARNRIILLKPNGETEEEHQEGVWTPEVYNPMHKTSAGYVTHDDGTVTFDWDLTFNADLCFINPPTIIEDKVNNDDNLMRHWFTSDELDRIEAAFDSEFRGKIDKSDYTFERIIFNNQNEKYQGYKLTINTEIPRNLQFSLHYQTVGTYDPMGINKYKNEAQINNMWSTGDRPEVTIEPDHPIVIKYDRSKYDKDSTDKNNSDTSHDYFDQYDDAKNGTIKWGIQMYVPSNTEGNLTLNEYVPAGVIVTQNGLNLKMINNDFAIPVTEGADGTSYTVDQTVDLSPKGKVGTVHITTEQRTVDGAEQTYLKLLFDEDAVRSLHGTNVYLNLDVKITDLQTGWQDDPDNTVLSIKNFNNVIEVKKNGNDVVSTDEQSQTIVKDKDHDVLTKTHGQASAGDTYNGNVVPYRIDINPEGRDLDLIRDTIEIDDVMQFEGDHYGCQLVLQSGSLSFTRVDENGVETPLDPSQYRAKLVPVDEGNNYVYKIVAEVPDEMHVVMRYNYMVTGPEAKKVNLKNTSGFGQFVGSSHSDEDRVEIRIQQSSGWARIAATTIRKVDYDDYTLGLPGAVFEIEYWNSATNQYEPFDVAASGSGQTDDSGDGSNPHRAPAQNINRFTTGTNGEFNLRLSFNTAYRLVEKVPPNGYIIDTSPFYFMIENTDTTHFPMCIPQDFEGHRMPTGSVIYYPDERQRIDLDVEKTWFDSTGKRVVNPDFDAITCELYRVTTAYIKGTNNYSAAVKIFSNWVDNNAILNNTADIFNLSGVFESGTKIKLEFLYKGDEWNAAEEKIIVLRDDNTTREILPTPGKNSHGNDGCKAQFVERNDLGEYIYKYEYEIDVTEKMTAYLSQLSSSSLVANSVKSSVEYPEGTLVGTQRLADFTLNHENEWATTIDDLPRYADGVAEDTSENMNKYAYSYYIVEEVPSGYEVEYINNDTQNGTDNGKIWIANSPIEKETTTVRGSGVTMPATGGSGKTAIYVAAAVLLMMSTVGVVLRRKKHGQ